MSNKIKVDPEQLEELQPIELNNGNELSSEWSDGKGKFYILPRNI